MFSFHFSNSLGFSSWSSLTAHGKFQVRQACFIGGLFLNSPRKTSVWSCSSERGHKYWKGSWGAFKVKTLMFSTSAAQRMPAGTLFILISPDDNELHSQVTILTSHFQGVERIHSPAWLKGTSRQMRLLIGEGLKTHLQGRIWETESQAGKKGAWRPGWFEAERGLTPSPGVGGATVVAWECKFQSDPV